MVSIGAVTNCDVLFTVFKYFLLVFITVIHTIKDSRDNIFEQEDIKGLINYLVIEPI